MKYSPKVLYLFSQAYLEGTTREAKYCQDKMSRDLVIVEVTVQRESMQTKLLIPKSDWDKLGLVGNTFRVLSLILYIAIICIQVVQWDSSMAFLL